MVDEGKPRVCVRPVNPYYDRLHARLNRPVAVAITRELIIGRCDRGFLSNWTWLVTH